jgi:hypothetical protein
MTMYRARHQRHHRRRPLRWLRLQHRRLMWRLRQSSVPIPRQALLPRLRGRGWIRRLQRQKKGSSSLRRRRPEATVVMTAVLAVPVVVVETPVALAVVSMTTCQC